MPFSHATGGRTPRWATLFVVALLSLPAQRAHAGGLYLMPRGTQPASRAGAFVAGADNPHALWYNPAGLVESKKQLVFDLTLPIVQTEFTRQYEDGSYSPTIKAPSAPVPIPTLAYTDNFGLDRWGFGLGFMVPNGAVSLWPDHVTVNGKSEPAPQRYSIINADGTFFGTFLLGAAVQPVDWLRFGFSGTLSIAQLGARVAVSACDYVICSQPEAPEWEATSQFLLDTQVFFGGVLGMTLDFDVVRVAFAYTDPHWGRGKALDGDATFDIALPDNLFFDDVTVDGDKANVSADLPMVLSGGVEVRPVDHLRVELAGSWQQWSVQNEIGVVPKDVIVRDVPTLGDVEAQSVSLERNMRDTYSVQLGGDYTFLDLFPGQRDLIVAGGLMYERSAFDNAWLSPVSPDTDKVMLSLGLSIQLTKNLLLDASYGHLFMKDHNVTNSEVLLPSVLRPAPGGPGDGGYEPGDQPRVGNGKYVMEANYISAGIRWQIPEDE